MIHETIAKVIDGKVEAVNAKIDIEYYRKKHNGRGLDMRKAMEADGYTRAEIDTALKEAKML